MSDSLLVLSAPAAGLRLILAVARQLSREASERHGLGPGSAGALAQALTGSLLLVAAERSDVAAAAGPAVQRPDPRGARVDLQLDCRGPLRGLLVDADGTGAVRGLVRVNGLGHLGRADSAEAGSSGRFDAGPLLRGAAGDDEVGMLSVLRRQAGGEGELHRALVPFAGADLGGGLTHFLQGDRPNAGHASLEVLIAPGQPLAAVGGALVEPLSGEAAGEARRVGEALRHGGLARLLEQAGTANAHALAQRLAEQHALGPLQLESELRPRFSCRCSRERLVRALSTLGAPELLDMADKDGGAQATCDFCATSYRVSREELVALAGQGERV